MVRPVTRRRAPSPGRAPALRGGIIAARAGGSSWISPGFGAGLIRAEKLTKGLEADDESVKVAVVLRRALRRGLGQLERESSRRRR